MLIFGHVMPAPPWSGCVRMNDRKDVVLAASIGTFVPSTLDLKYEPEAYGSRPSVGVGVGSGVGSGVVDVVAGAVVDDGDVPTEFDARTTNLMSAASRIGAVHTVDRTLPATRTTGLV